MIFSPINGELIEGKLKVIPPQLVFDLCFFSSYTSFDQQWKIKKFYSINCLVTCLKAYKEPKTRRSLRGILS